MTNKANGILLQVTGVLFFGILFALAWVFFKERMLNYDPAFFSFRILFEKNYDVELGRWGSVVSQTLPLLFLKAGCSLETFLRVYSVSFIVIYYMIFLFISLVLKNARAAIILMFTLCLAFRHAFYYSTAELYQGLAISVLVLALVFPVEQYSSPMKKNLAYFFSCVLIFVLSYYHQILVFPLLFIFFYYLISEKKYADKYLIGAIAFTAVWFFVRIKFLTATDYEQDKIPRLDFIFSQVSNITQLESFTFFNHFIKHFLLSLFILNVICVGSMIYNRKWLLAFFYCCFNAAFIYLNIIVCAKGESPLMNENYLTILGLFCAVPLTDQLLKIKSVKLLWPAIIIILMVGLQGIYSSRTHFSQRVAYFERITSIGKKFPNKKYIIDYRCFPWKYAWVSWALPFETLLYSSLQSPDSAISVCVAKPINQYDSIASWKNIFIGPAFSPTWFWTNELDHHYFNLPGGDYKKINTSQNDSGFTESVFNNSNVTITSKENNFEVSNELYLPISIQIKNTSGYRINSITDSKHAIFLCYHVYDDKGKQIRWDGIRTDLEHDIYEEAEVAVILKNDLPKGNYTVEIDFISEAVRWWNINTRVKLIVK